MNVVIKVDKSKTLRHLIVVTARVVSVFLVAVVIHIIPHHLAGRAGQAVVPGAGVVIQLTTVVVMVMMIVTVVALVPVQHAVQAVVRTDGVVVMLPVRLLVMLMVMMMSLFGLVNVTTA